MQETSRMGDRTTTETTIAASDLDAVRELLAGREAKADGFAFADEHDNGDGTVSFARHDVNYGGEYDADAMQKASIPFLIRHESGGSYPAGFTAFDGATRRNAYGCEDGLTIRFDEETGEANAEDLAGARDFVALRRRTLDAMIARGTGRGGA